MVKYKVAAIDPGKAGGYAVYYGQDLYSAGLIDFDDPRALYRALAGCDDIVIERAQAAPAQGISSAFEYGRSFGRTEAVAILTEAKIYYVAPSWWKGKLSVPADKKLALETALKRVPGLSKYVWLTKHNGIAEAALMGKLLIDGELFSELVKNNEAREKPKRKRTSYRL
jgi:hypothetical protein